MQTFWVLDVENDGEDWTAAKPVKALSMGGAAQEFMDSELSDLAAEYEDEPVTALVMVSRSPDGSDARTFRISYHLTITRDVSEATK